MVLLEFSMAPVGQGESMSAQVARVLHRRGVRSTGIRSPSCRGRHRTLSVPTGHLYSVMDKSFGACLQ
jgi:hypothetical protein